MPSTKSSSTESTRTLAGDRDKLVADLKVLIEDAKLLTTDATGASHEFMSDKAEDLREQLSEALEKLKKHGESTKKIAAEKTKDVEKLIRENPWQSLGIAVVAGIVIDRLLRD